ncbi:MAG: hypothetical protein L6Q37_16330, partial [Bdellovibrionaceae bacterium]|nr:hypothetical protein [Pseudobdellovibrionaceae bacterium]
LVLNYENSHALGSINKCLRSYSPINKDEVGRFVNYDYVKDLLENLAGKYSITTVTDLSPVMNQKNWGFCHLYSFFTEITREYKQRNNGVNPAISMHYMAFHHWLNRSIKTALNPDSPLRPEEGGWYIYDIELFKEIGAMKEEDFVRLGGTKVPEEKFQKFLEDQVLAKQIHEAHKQQDLINAIFKDNFTKEEIYQLTIDSEMKLATSAKSSSFSQESRLIEAKKKYIQSLLDNSNGRTIQEIKDLVRIKQEELKNGTTAFTREQIELLEKISDGKIYFSKLSSELVKSLKDNLQKDIKEGMTKLFSKFFFGKENVPVAVMDKQKNIQMAKELFPEISQKTISISVDEANRRFSYGLAPESNTDKVNKHIYLKGSLVDIYEIIAEQIEKYNNGVWVGYDHNDSFVDHEKGLMSIKAFEHTPRSPYISRYDRFTRGSIISGGHAVQYVGVIREKVTPLEEMMGVKGKIIGFLMQNSWGTATGNKGFYVVDTSYSDAFLFGITIRDESADKKIIKQNDEAKKAAEHDLNQK